MKRKVKLINARKSFWFVFFEPVYKFKFEFVKRRIERDHTWLSTMEIQLAVSNSLLVSLLIETARFDCHLEHFSLKSLAFREREGERKRNLIQQVKDNFEKWQENNSLRFKILQLTGKVMKTFTCFPQYYFQLFKSCAVKR